MVLFLLGLIIVPLRIFATYTNTLFSAFLIIVPIYILIEIYYFFKDIPRRRDGTLPKKKKNKIFTIAEWTFLGIVIIVLLLARSGVILKQDCPDEIQGNPQAELNIKYFFNPFCPNCWKQETIVQKILNSYRSNISLERYDHRYCEEEERELGLKMVPGFLFQFDNETESFGFLSEREMSNIICERIEC